MTVRKTLANIEPFNELFYKECFFNSFFPIVRRYGMSIQPYILNDLIVYDANLFEQEKLIGCEYVAVRDSESIMHEQGIRVYKKPRSLDLIGDIKAALLADRPVIVWVDLFSEAIRTDAYQKHHWQHSLLVFGYDDLDEVFQIVEHKHRENLSYEKRTIRYRELVAAYEGLHTHFQPTEETFTYLEFEYDPAATSAREMTPDDQLATFARQMIARRDLIERGIDQVHAFGEYLVQIATHPEDATLNLEALLDGLNQVLNAKQVERYRMEALVGENAPLLVTLDAVLDDWGFVRATIAKQLYSGVFRPKAFQDALAKLQAIPDKERTYWKHLW